MKHLLMALALGIALEAPQYKRTSLVTLDASIEVRAPATRVFERITSADGFCALTGFQTTEPAQRLGRVGEWAPASVWGDVGRLVCIYVLADKELRVAFEPDNGHYLCQKRVTLEALGSGTRIRVVDRYTDDQPDSVDATAKAVSAEMTKTLAAFRAALEKP